MQKVIHVENVSKLYRLGSVGTGSLGHDLNRWWHMIRGKEDPYLKIGEQSNRDKKGESDFVWALKDISFDVFHGDVLGIIGHNGAGKSTLLKILSRTTAPTTGKLKVKGKIASLLEVGTGFHPELSGRENIYLNGTILGMTKKEITRKFDEIVDFAGVERYIDTPVKRYSSGMYVRLAFAVAAHLDPEILIVDEVLAVGDAEFQKKALGKMQEVSTKEGRTVLFVSHNMAAMNSLCTKIAFMKQGQIVCVGDPQATINEYMRGSTANKYEQEWTELDAPGDAVAKLLHVRLTDENRQPAFAIDFSAGGFIEFTYEIRSEGYHPIPNVHLFDKFNEYVLVSTADHAASYNQKGTYISTVKIPPHFLNNGVYTAGVALSTYLPHTVHFYEKEALRFEVVENMETRNTQFRGKLPGVVRPLLDWEIGSKQTKNNIS